MKKIGTREVIIGVLIIAIIGVILAMGVVNYSKIRQESRNENKMSSREEILKYNENNNEEINIDLSEYEETGEFTEDGIAWVYKEDYSGKGCGYINKNGEFVIPIQEDILQTDSNSLSKGYDDYHNGIVLIAKNVEWGKYSITAYDTNGNVVSSMVATSPYIHIKRFQGVKNPFIFVRDDSSVDSEAYIFDMSTKKFKQIREKDYWSFGDNFSDGLLYCYTKDISKVSISYLDENGNEALEITTKSNENYVGIITASDFIDGEATLLFTGKDGNDYTVTIDKKGNWLDEPVKHKNSENIRND